MPERREHASREEGDRKAMRRRATHEPIRLLPPTFVELSEDEAQEVVRLLAEVIRRAVRRRALEQDPTRLGDRPDKD